VFIEKYFDTPREDNILISLLLLCSNDYVATEKLLVSRTVPSVYMGID
jgi:hypothetical protein